MGVLFSCFYDPLSGDDRHLLSIEKSDWTIVNEHITKLENRIFAITKSIHHLEQDSKASTSEFEKSRIDQQLADKIDEKRQLNSLLSINDRNKTACVNHEIQKDQKDIDDLWKKIESETNILLPKETVLHNAAIIANQVKHEENVSQAVAEQNQVLFNADQVRPEQKQDLQTDTSHHSAKPEPVLLTS